MSRALVLNATYDGTYVDYVYEIYLPTTPTHYELTDNETETTAVTVYGYNYPVTIDPEIGDGTETVSLYFDESLGGEAVAEINDGLYYEILIRPWVFPSSSGLPVRSSPWG